MNVGHITLRRTILICTALLSLLALALIGAAVIGSQRLPFAGSLCALAGSSNCALSAEERAILFDIRLPRIVLAGAVGMCLAAAGAAYQALLRNPLAEPYLLGVSNGAAVGTMAALVFFTGYEWSRPIMAFAGAGAATFVVYRLARGRAGATPERLILAGVIVTTFLSSGIVFITTVMDATRIRSFTFWLLGDLSGTTGSRIRRIGPIGHIGRMLEAKKISINYDERTAVCDVSLRAEPGNVIAILGPNGAGKSTLLRALNGSIAPAGGEVLLDGKPLRTFARRVVARQIGMVAQEADLRFPVTVFEFVLGGRYAWSSAEAWGWENEHDIEVAQNSIRETELAGFESRLMNGAVARRLTRSRRG